MTTTKLNGEIINLIGSEININDLAPQVIVVDENMEEVEIGGKKDKVQLITIIPSLDTPICAAQTRKFNEEVSRMDGVEAIAVSLDLPFAAERFCETEGITTLKVTSDFRDKSFSKSYGVLMQNGSLQGLTCRAIFVVNKEGIVSYKHINEEITEHPNYEAALQAVKEAI